MLDVSLLVQTGIVGLFAAFVLIILRLFSAHLVAKDAANLALIKDVTGRMEAEAKERLEAIVKLSEKSDARHEECHVVQREAYRAVHEISEAIRRAGYKQDDLARDVRQAASDAKAALPE